MSYVIPESVKGLSFQDRMSFWTGKIAFAIGSGNMDSALYKIMMTEREHGARAERSNRVRHLRQTVKALNEIGERHKVDNLEVCEDIWDLSDELASVANKIEEEGR